jgi:hypothetical protein
MGVGLKSTSRFKRWPTAQPLAGQADGVAKVTPPARGALLTADTERTARIAKINQVAGFFNIFNITIIFVIEQVRLARG